MNKKYKNKQGGAAMFIAVIFLIFISLAVIGGLAVPSVREYKVASESISSKKSYFLAESGVEDAYYRILNNKPISNSETINLDSNSTTTAITSSSGKKEIVSLGNVSSYQRKVDLSLVPGVGISFNYGVQAGLGGIDIYGSSGVNGNVYADGPITGSTSAYISGTAISAGSTGLIQGSSLDQNNQLSVGTSGSGTAQAHTVNYTEATGLIYCQSGTGNNKSCTSQADPTYVAYPITDANITTWKNEAQIGGTYDGDYNTLGYGTTILGPELINGNLNVTGSNTLYVTGTLWVKGNITVSGAAKIVLDNSYGNNSGVIVSDGLLDLEGSGQLNGTGQAGSYILFITTSSDTFKCNKNLEVYSTICVTGVAGSVILNAQNGVIGFAGSASAKEATAYKMILVGNTTVNYESGLANVNFTSGPSGSWHIGGWKETQ